MTSQLIIQYMVTSVIYFSNKHLKLCQPVQILMVLIQEVDDMRSRPRHGATTIWLVHLLC